MLEDGSSILYMVVYEEGKGLFGYSFWRLFFVSKNNQNKENRENIFSFLYFSILKNSKKIKQFLRGKNKFLKIKKLMFGVSKTILKNIFKKQ